MQNMMPQLNLPGKAVQQQAQTSRSSGNSKKSSQKEDDFRNLLENSSKSTSEDASAKKTDLKRDRSDQKLDAQKPLKKENANSADDKKDVSDEDILLNAEAGMQAMQFLMMGSNHPETLQVLSGSMDDGMIAQIQTDTSWPLTVQVLPEEMPVEPQVPQETVSAQIWTGEATGQTQVSETIAGTVSQEEAEPVLQSQTVGLHKDIQRNNSAEDSGKPQQNKAVGETGKIKPDTGHSVQIEKKSVQQSDVEQRHGQQANNTSEKTNQPSQLTDQTHASEIAFQPASFQNQMQGAEDIMPTVHVQVEDPQELMNQLMEQLKAKATMGDQEFEVQLHPEKLGKLAIKVAYTAEKVSISIVCSNQKTMELLSSGSKNIAQIMEENLGAPTTVVVDQEESNYLEQYNNQENARQQQQEPEKHKEKKPEDEHQDFLQQLRLGLI